MTAQTHKRNVNKKALLRAVQFVREVRENSLKKASESTAEAAKRIRVNNGYPSALRSMGILNGEKWNQNGMTDHDIAISIMRFCALRKYKKTSEIDFHVLTETKKERVPAKPTTEKAKKTPKAKVVKASSAQPPSKRYVIRIFGKEVFSREVA